MLNTYLYNNEHSWAGREFFLCPCHTRGGREGLSPGGYWQPLLCCLSPALSSPHRKTGAQRFKDMPKGTRPSGAVLGLDSYSCQTPSPVPWHPPLPLAGKPLRAHTQGPETCRGTHSDFCPCGGLTTSLLHKERVMAGFIVPKTRKEIY